MENSWIFSADASLIKEFSYRGISILLYPYVNVFFYSIAKAEQSQSMLLVVSSSSLDSLDEVVVHNTMILSMIWRCLSLLECIAKLFSLLRRQLAKDLTVNLIH